MALSLKPITKTASFTLDRHIHAGGQTVNISALAGLTVTLPASAGTGDEYEIFVVTTVTSNGYIIKVANATDIMAGGVSVSTDAGGVTILTGTTDDTITMNGSTTGGLIGSSVKLKDVSTGFWRVTGFLVSTGSEATPFSATVS